MALFLLKLAGHRAQQIWNSMQVASATVATTANSRRDHGGLLFRKMGGFSRRKPVLQMKQETPTWWRAWYEDESAKVYHVNLTPDTEFMECATLLLDNPELQRLDRLKVERAMRVLALCRAALRLLLSVRSGCRNRQISFDSSVRGKPIALVDGRPADMHFNVSHSGSHGFIAIGTHACVGVDVEVRASGRDLEGIGRLVFGPNELRLLGGLTGQDQINLFYRLWSMKEALIKAPGTGFSIGPDSCEIPELMLRGASAGKIRFQHLPLKTWRLLDLGEKRFAAALAYRLLHSPGPAES